MQVAGELLALLAAGDVPFPFQQRGLVHGHRGLLGHRKQELQLGVPDDLAGREEGVRMPTGSPRASRGTLTNQSH